MPKASVEQIKTIPHSKLSKVIDKARSRLKQDQVVKNMFKEFKVDIDELDLIPICFSDLEVSARTEHGIIYLNYKLLETGDFEGSDHYLVHEMTHFCQQTTGEGPTKGSNDDDYLDNPYEQEGFRNQTEYISETKGDEKAEEYVSKVLDHHEVPENEKEERKEELLQLASALGMKQRKRPSDQLGLKFIKEPSGSRLDKTREEMLADFERAVAGGPRETHARPPVKKMSPTEQEYRMKELAKLLRTLDSNDAAYFWDDTGSYNAEHSTDSGLVNPNQLPIKFRNLSNSVHILVKKFNKLTPNDIKQLDRLKLNSDSNMGYFLTDWNNKEYIIDDKKYMPLAIIAVDKDTKKYVGWMLVRPHSPASSEHNVELRIDTMIDRAYRREGLGSLLTQKLNEIKQQIFPNAEVLISGWSPTSKAFYHKTNNSATDEWIPDEDTSEDNELEQKVSPSQLSLPFKE